MVRSIEDELQHRCELRKKYFEDPSYRRWSDVVPGGLNGMNYRDWRDDRLFDCLITNQSDVQSTATNLISHLDKGSQLPINWLNFYAYFDERLNDPRNRYLPSITDPNITGGPFEQSTSVKRLLNRYRDQLVQTYDMI